MTSSIHRIQPAATAVATNATGSHFRPVAKSQTRTVETVTITPEVAATWLETYNTHNRDFNDRRAAEYAREMSSGRWHFNGEPIQFDRDNVLLNGQHRLWAVVMSGTTQEFVVIHGLPPESQLTMDQGTRRSPAEQLQVANMRVGNSVAAAIRVYIRWQTGRIFGDQVRNKVSTTEVVEWAQANADLVDALSSLEPKGSIRLVPCPPSTTLAIALNLHLIDDSAADFFVALATGADLSVGSPVLALRNRLLKDKTAGVRLSERDLIALFVMAWNAYRDERRMTKLQRPVGAVWTRENFPVPH